MTWASTPCHPLPSRDTGSLSVPRAARPGHGIPQRVACCHAGTWASTPCDPLPSGDTGPHSVPPVARPIHGPPQRATRCQAGRHRPPYRATRCQTGAWPPTPCHALPSQDTGSHTMPPAAKPRRLFPPATTPWHTRPGTHRAGPDRTTRQQKGPGIAPRPFCLPFSQPGKHPAPRPCGPGAGMERRRVGDSPTIRSSVESEVRLRRAPRPS